MHKLLRISWLAIGLFLPSACSSEPEEQPYNVLLISIDSLRQDHLGIYGHKPEFAPEIPVSPNLDAIGKTGFVFDNAWSTTSWTLPAHISLLTGLSDRLHGVETDDWKLDPLRTTIAEVFQQAGYQTAGIYSGPYLDPQYGFQRGFDRYESAMLSPQELQDEVRKWAEELQRNGRPAPTESEWKQFRNRVSHWDITSPKVNALATDFLQKNDGSRPFFLFLHYFDAHYDHIPDQAEAGLARKFDPDYQGSFNGSNWYFNTAVREARPPHKRLISERDLAHVKALYDAEIHWVDRHIGEILNRLEDMNLSDRTIVCIVSDHGDEFFEHGSIGHRSTLHTELTKIPLILNDPRLGNDPGSTLQERRLPQTVRIYDVAPTLLDLCDLQTDANWEGVSLKALLNGTAAPSLTALQRIQTGVGGIREAWRNDRFTVAREMRRNRQRSEAAGKQVFFQTRNRETRTPYFRVYDRREDPWEQSPLDQSDSRYAEAIAAYCAASEVNETLYESMSHSVSQQRQPPALGPAAQAVLDQLGYSANDEEMDNEELLPIGPFPPPCPEEER